jgi:hypothetical protein
MNRSAILSPQGSYRYELRRWWGESGKGLVNFIGLNPSIADAYKDDPTIRRCIGFARDWGYDGLIMTNLYAYRTPEPEQLWKAQRVGIGITGSCNFDHVRSVASEAAIVIAAWGTDKKARIQAQHILSLISRDVYAIKISESSTSKDRFGLSPLHPLYLSKNLKPVIYREQS